ncbi:MAG TPA: transcriptional repressor LexA [Steroidobacteraceae bacterium]
MVSGSPLPLSPRQRQVLQRISEFIAHEGRPPTRADLARALGLRNRQGIDQHLRALEHKGYLRLEPGIARGLRLLHGEPMVPRTAVLPLYGRVAAGVPTLAQSNIEEHVALDRALFRPRADFLLRVHGQSMRDAGIAHRDILAVHRTHEAVNGQIVVARRDDEATVKFYRRDGFMLRLEPANPDFSAIEADLRTQPWQIEGLVVGIVRTAVPRG